MIDGTKLSDGLPGAPKDSMEMASRAKDYIDRYREMGSLTQEEHAGYIEEYQKAVESPSRYKSLLELLDRVADNINEKAGAHLQQRIENKQSDMQRDRFKDEAMRANRDLVKKSNEMSQDIFNLF